MKKERKGVGREKIDLQSKMSIVKEKETGGEENNHSMCKKCLNYIITSTRNAPSGLQLEVCVSQEAVKTSVVCVIYNQRHKK